MNKIWLHIYNQKWVKWLSFVNQKCKYSWSDSDLNDLIMNENCSHVNIILENYIQFCNQI